MQYPVHLDTLRTFFGAGPTNVHPAVTQELSRPLVSHLDPLFREIFIEVREFLQYVMHTQSSMTFPLQGPGSFAMEACLANLIEPGDTIVVMDNGFYGNRFKEIAQRYQARIITITYSWGAELNPEDLEDVLKKNKNVKVACFVHGESSTGVVSDIQSLSRICRKHNVLSICDIAATLGGIPILVDEWELDAVYANPQKCLSAPPGLSPISISDRAMHKILNRATPVQGWCLDLSALYHLSHEDPPRRFYPHTSPVHSFYALHKALNMMYEEGIERIWARHAYNCESLSEALQILGFQHRAPANARSPLVNVVEIPKGLIQDDILKHLRHHHTIEISKGMGKWEHDTLRMGVMGQSCTHDMVIRLVQALGETLQHFQKPVNIKKALTMAQRLAFHDKNMHVSSHYDASRNSLSA